jgi:hypothetical protein
MNKTLQEYLISTLITFVTGMLTYVAVAMESAETFADLSWKAVLLGAIFAGLRLAVKAVLQFLPKLIEKIKK